MQEKKDVQGLLNNVIEETAGKLVETGNSKVKALVGDFKTVISLHNKPSAVTVSLLTNGILSQIGAIANIVVDIAFLTWFTYVCPVSHSDSSS
ncbi:hypothetical protein CQW23_32214 [Capsicum baccatum]|uniref:Calmodulin-binding domain-containing protein n=1 Tax=Capsicum baccatum TaxID=33114 RepID=A0A2G2V5B8_CAPBA|nr:hypothetical protein CQW23_32214 [Capsicum baccatum]